MSKPFKYTSTKEWIDAFPCAYRQWRADSHCRELHGYAFSIKVFFGCNELDTRNWCFDYGGLRPLKATLEDFFDHTLLVAQDDPHKDAFLNLHELGIAKVVEVEATGCEALSRFLHEYINTIFLPSCGKAEAERVWCYRVEVRETQSNMAFYEALRDEVDYDV